MKRGQRKWMWIVCAATALFMAAGAAVGPGVAQAPRPFVADFERPDDGAPAATNWYTTSAHHPGRVSLDLDTAVQGAASLRLDGRGAAYFVDRQSRGIPGVEPGKTYAVRVAIRRTSLQGQTSLTVFHTAPDGQQYKGLAAFGGAPTRGLDCWEYFTGTFRFPEKAKEPSIILYAVNTEGVSWFDDIEVREVSPEEKPFSLRCARAAAPPAIDGRLTEWSGVDRATDFMLLGPAAIHPLKSAAQTFVQLAYDDRCLYVAAVLEEPAGYVRRAATGGRDGPVWSDDSLELLLSPKLGSKAYYHVCINAKGAVYDAYKSPEATGFGDTAWSPATRVQVVVGEAGWQLEAAIPLESLEGFQPEAGNSFAANFCREMHGKPSEAAGLSSWARIEPGGGFHNPEVFQEVAFSNLDATPRETSNYRWLRGAGILANGDFAGKRPNGEPSCWVRREDGWAQKLLTTFYPAGSTFDVTLLASSQRPSEVRLSYQTPDGQAREVGAALEAAADALRVGRLALKENAATLTGFFLACPKGELPKHVQMTGARGRRFHYRNKELKEFFLKQNQDIIPKGSAATLALYPSAMVIRGFPSQYPFSSIQNITEWVYPGPGPMVYVIPGRADWRLALDLPRGIEIYSTGLFSRLQVKTKKPVAEESPRGPGYQRYVLDLGTLTHVGQVRPCFISALPVGSARTGYYALEWDGGRQPAESFPIEIAEALRIKAPDRFVAGVYLHPLDDNPQKGREGTILDDPRAPEILKSFHDFGVNLWILDNGMWGYVPAERPQTDRFIQSARAAGIELAFCTTGFASPMLEIARRTGRPRAELPSTVTMNGDDGGGVCISYRGPVYQEMIRTWGELVKHGIYWIDNNWEDWNYRGHTICFCPRCKEGFRDWLRARRPELPYRDPAEVARDPGKFPELHEAWLQFKSGLIVQWLTDVRNELKRNMAAAGVQKPGFPRLGMTVCEGGWDWKRITEETDAYYSPMLYAYMSQYAEPAVDTTARRFYEVRLHEKVDRRKYVITIAPAERTGEATVPDKTMMYQVLEVAASGASGFKVWYQEVMNGGMYYWMARALRMIQPAEDLLLDGKMQTLACDNPNARVRLFSHSDGRVLFVSEYGLGKTSVRVAVDCAAPGAAFDLDSDKQVASLKAGRNEIGVSLDADRVRALFIGTPKQWRQVQERRR